MCGEIGFCVAVWGDYMRKKKEKCVVAENFKFISISVHSFASRKKTNINNLKDLEI